MLITGERHLRLVPSGADPSRNGPHDGGTDPGVKPQFRGDGDLLERYRSAAAPQKASCSRCSHLWLTLIDKSKKYRNNLVLATFLCHRLLM